MIEFFSEDFKIKFFEHEKVCCRCEKKKRRVEKEG
jgi:hypothetical protein